MDFAASILFGIALLIAGRRLFWLFVGAVGFLYGLSFAPLIFEGGSELLLLVIALVCGVIGTVLAIFAQKLAVGMAGALVGGYLLSELTQGAHWQHAHFAGIPFLIGALVGALLVIALFDWALIIWSSIAGSLLIIQSFHPATLNRHILFLVLTALGIFVQAELLRRQRLVVSYRTPPA